jgi:glycosyltransferase involved in cell wall biosynthesis
MKILLATPSLRKEVGGPAYSVGSINAFLKNALIETVTYTQRAKGGKAFPLIWNDGVLDGVDLVHNFGTWTAFNHRISVKARQARIPQVFCPMGMLEPWSLAQKRLKKRIGWALYQRRDIDLVSVVHATARLEAVNLRALGIKTPIALISHGIDLPGSRPARRSVDGESREKTMLFLSRIHHKKGLLELVEACSRLKSMDWNVIVAGPDQDGYQVVIEEAVRVAGLGGRFSFVGPVYGEQKAELFYRADLFVLPTHSENFGLVVPEALSYGVPVITTTGAPWAEINEVDCGWWIPTGAAALESALAVALSMPNATLAEMGARGRTLVETRYSWPVIIQKHITLYRWLVGGGQRPNFILD